MRVGTESIVRHELVGDPQRENVIETSRNVDRRQLCSLRVDIDGQLVALARKIRRFGICLGADGDVLARRHGHGTRDESGDSRDARSLPGGARGSHAENQAGDRHDAVVGT